MNTSIYWYADKDIKKSWIERLRASVERYVIGEEMLVENKVEKLEEKNRFLEVS